MAFYPALAILGLTLGSPVVPAIDTGPVSKLEWKALLERAKAGGVIDLGQRRVDFMRLKFQPTAPVTIRGGKFGPIALDQWHNVTFVGSDFSASAPTVEYRSLLTAYQPVNLRIQKCHFTGYQADDGQLRIRGVLISDGHDVTIEGSTFEHMAGVNGLKRAQNVRFAHNIMRNVREGMQIQGGSHIQIDSNRFEELRPFKGDHTDAIQFFTTGLTKPDDAAAHDVIITNNIIIAANTSQGIFMGDELRLRQSGRGYKRFLVEGNLIIGAVWHGITASPVAGLTIRRNLVLRLKDRDLRGNRITASGESVVVEDNVADAYILGDAVSEHRNRKLGPMPVSQMNKIIADWTRTRQIG
jgi:hypothetical protein